MTAANSAASRLEALLEVLAREKALLEELFELAQEEQQALLSSDFPAIQYVSDRMLYAARRIDVLEEERESTLAPITSPTRRAQVFRASGSSFVRSVLRVVRACRTATSSAVPARASMRTT